MAQSVDHDLRLTDLHGSALLDQIDRHRVALPRQTLLAMAVGGVRVRGMRSTVTLVSVVLAIAFLCFTGVSNQLVFRLASVAETGFDVHATQIVRLLRQNRINTRLVLDEGNPLDTWLIVMALLTCGVGITNAMLMSVTERFREIGTMKCLGAIDGLVVKLFLIESGLLGLVGSALGILLGLVVAVLAASLQYGSYGMVHFPWLASIKVIGWSVLAGMVLAVFAAVYPAVVAARMNPVDALRVDE